MTERPRYDGLGIAMLGLVALMLTGIAAAGFIRTPPAVDDTSVQTSMAWSSWAMVIVSIAGGVIGALSLYLIFRTLQAARTSAQAAVDTANITREIGMAQARAYVSLESAKLRTETADAYFTIELTLRNSGQSPAQEVVVETEVELAELQPISDDLGAEEVVLAKFQHRTDFHDIAANQTASVRPLFVTIKADYSLATGLAETYLLIVSIKAEVKYLDVFRAQFVERSNFRLAVRNEEALKSGLEMPRVR